MTDYREWATDQHDWEDLDPPVQLEGRTANKRCVWVYKQARLEDGKWHCDWWRQITFYDADETKLERLETHRELLGTVPCEEVESGTPGAELWYLNPEHFSQYEDGMVWLKEADDDN